MRKLILLLALLLAATVAVVPFAGGAQALEANTVVANASTSWQTNGTVWALAYARGVVYASGDFTSVRPPGAAAGTGEVARNHLAAFDSTTGALLSFNHDLNAKAWAMVPSADGSTLYVGGDFSTIDGASRVKLAAFDTATGALTSWAPKVSGSVRGMAIHGTTVYFSGSFSTVFASGASGTRKNLAAVTTAGTLLPWAPTADLTVFRVAVAPDGGKVFAGGYFTNLNGVAMRGTGALDATTGATLPWASANVLPPHSGTCTSDIRDIRVDASNVYFAAEGTGGGCFDGTFAARQSDGALVWKNTCLGATQSIEIIGSFLYKGSHAHNCSSVPGGFPEVGTGNARHLLVEKLSDGLLGPWYPNTNGNPLGPRAFATDGTQLFVGGDFLTVNNKAQQGLTRFGGPPDLTKPRQPKAPTAISTTSGQVRLSWQATTDDDETLVYRVYRDGATTPLFTSAPTRSTFWILPTLSFTDTGLVGGSTHSYRVDAKEANGTNVSAKSAATSVTVTGDGVTPSYRDTVIGDSPSQYLRLGETSGPTAADASGNGRTGLYQGTVTFGQAGAIANDANTAVLLGGSGTTNGYVTQQSTTATTNPTTFSVELWFKTSTTTGGKLIGFGSSRTGTSAQYDRHIYMTDTGTLVFGAWAGKATTIATTASYNNNAWHHVVGTLGSGGMFLYVDGARVASSTNTVAQAYNGFWRIGGDNLNLWPSRPTSDYFKGTVDEAAVYPTVLSATQVSEHFTRGRP